MFNIPQASVCGGGGGGGDRCKICVEERLLEMMQFEA